MSAKLQHVLQTSNIALNVFVIALLTVISTPNAGVVILGILIVDCLIEVGKLIFIKPNDDPKKAKTEGALRTMSSIFNLSAILLLIVPSGIPETTTMTVVLVIVIIDTIVEIVELVKMQ